MTAPPLTRPPSTGAPARRRRGAVVTVLAALFLGGIVLLPSSVEQVSPAAFLRLPLELVLAGALLMVLPGRLRRIATLVLGVTLGLLLVLKLLDLGFSTALARPFDPVLDWPLFADAFRFVDGAAGRAAAVVAAVAVVALAVAALAVPVRAVRRLDGAAARHPGRAWRGFAALAVAWVTAILLGLQLVPGLPVADDSTTAAVRARVALAQERLADSEAFAAELATDPFRGTPPAGLLAGLRGKDVVFAVVESYGRSAVSSPRLTIAPVLAEGDRELAAAGYDVRSGWLTSSTSGGGSWLAHASLLSGVWVDNQQRFDTLLASDRLTLGAAFRAAGWHTVGVMPNTTEPWPQGQALYGYDRLATGADLGYAGPPFSWSAMPDQFTLAAFQRTERARSDRAPVFAELALTSSHAPWTAVPRPVPWETVGDGSVFDGTSVSDDSDTRVIFSLDPEQVRDGYRSSVAYSLETIVSWVQTYGDDNLVLVVLGDHEPTPLVTGDAASRDVPISVITRDRAVLDRIGPWGWTAGLAPAPDAPVWRMDAFRDRFLTAFGAP
ncbi:MAG: sulfatase [Pseudonocardia sp.]